MFKNILVPTDGSKLSQKAVKAAIDLAHDSNAKVTALHVFPKFSGSPYGTYGPAEDVLEEAHRNLAQAEGDRLFTTLRKSADAAGVQFDAVLVENNNVWEQVISVADRALYVATSNRDGRGRPDAADDRIMRLRTE